MIVQCLVYACQVDPIVPEPGVVGMVKMLQGMAKDFQGKSIPLAGTSMLTFTLFEIAVSAFSCPVKTAQRT